MRNVLYRMRITGGWGEYKYPGKFHQWAVGYEEFETGPGNYTYAIVELEDGTIEEILPSNIKFID